MRKVNVLTSLAAVGLASGLAAPAMAADDLSYSYLELGYVNSELDDADVEGDGFGLRGSYGFTERLHGFVEYTDLDFDFDVTASSLELGVGMNWELSPRVDIVGTVSYVTAEVEADVPGFGQFSVDDDGFGVGAALRGRVSEQLELRGGLDLVSFDERGEDTTFGFGARYYFTKLFAVGADLDFNDDGMSWMLGARFNLNK